MTKVSKQQVLDEIHEGDIWQDMDEYHDEYWKEYWDDIYAGEMSWQWYMSLGLVRNEGWRYVVINSDYKSDAVKHWLTETYPGCEYKNEGEHFMFKDNDVAMMVALKWT